MGKDYAGLTCFCPSLIAFFAALGLAQSVADIKLVQEKLSAYDAGKVDGVMGAKTRAAILA